MPSYTSETDSLLGGKKKHLLLDDESIDDKSLRDKISEEIFGSFFILLVKSTQVTIPFAVAVILCVVETMQILSLLTSPIFYWSNALSGIVHDILGITSFISLHIYSAVPLFWIAFAMILLLMMSFLLLLIFQSAYVNQEKILKGMRGLFCAISHVCFIPIIILCLSAMTCRMGTTVNVTDFGYCWDFNLATTLADGANGLFQDASRPIVSTAIRTVMIMSIPALIVHILFGFTYSSIMYEDNPTNAATQYTSMTHPRAMIIMNLLKACLVTLTFVLHQYIPMLVIAALCVFVTYLMAYTFITSLPYYSFAMNEIYAAALTFQCWVAICAFVATALNTPNDHTTAVIVYLTMPLALLMGAQLTQIRRRKIELCDSLELRSATDCEAKVRFMLEPVTETMSSNADIGDLAGMLPEHQPYLQKGSQWYSQACERWPTDASLAMAAARFHTIYLRDTYSSTRYAKRALFSQPSLDTQFALYRLQQLISHMYEEQQHSFDYVDTNMVADDNEIAAHKQRRHRDMMINMALERHIAEAVSAETKANRAQMAFWDEFSRKRPRTDYLSHLAHEVADNTEKFATLCGKIEKMRQSMNQNSRKVAASTHTGVNNDVSTTALRSSKDAQDLEDDDNTIASGRIVVTLNPPSRLKPVDKTNPSSVSSTIALNSAVSQFSTVNATVDDAALMSEEEGAKTNTVKTIGGLTSVSTGDKRGYTAKDFVFANDSPFRLEEVDDDVYSMFGYVPEDLFATKQYYISSSTHTSATAAVSVNQAKGPPIYNSSVFFFEPNRSEHRDFLRKYALLALHAIISSSANEDNTDADDHVEAIENSSPIERLLARFAPIHVLCQHADGTVFPARVFIKPIAHPSSPLSLLITFHQLRLPQTSAIVISSPDGAIVTTSRSALSFFNPKLHMLLRRPHAPPLLSQQLLSLVGLPIADSSTAQLDMRQKRAAFSTSMDDHRDMLAHYLHTHNITEWLPEYHQLRHNIKQNGITIRIPIARIAETLQKQAAVAQSASQHHNFITYNNKQRQQQHTGKSSGKLSGKNSQDSHISNYITTSDGITLYSVPVDEHDFDLSRLSAYEATIRIWISPLLNRCRLDHTSASMLPAAMMQRAQPMPGADLPAVGTSGAYRRVASLYLPQHAWKETGPVLALSPRTKNSFVPMSGMVESSTGFIYEPSELICPLDADFFFKYRRKEQQMREIRDALIAREGYLFDDSDRGTSGGSGGHSSLPASARGLYNNNSNGSGSARTGLNSGRLSARGKTTSLLTPRGDDVDTGSGPILLDRAASVGPMAHERANVAVDGSTRPMLHAQTSVASGVGSVGSGMGRQPSLPRLNFDSVPPNTTINSYGNGNGNLSRNGSDSPKFVHQSSMPPPLAHSQYASMGSMPNLLHQASMAPKLGGNTHYNMGNGSGNGSGSESAKVQNASIFPDYGDVIYIDVLELYVPTKEEDDMPDAYDIGMGSSELEPVVSMLNLTGLHGDAVNLTMDEEHSGSKGGSGRKGDGEGSGSGRGNGSGSGSGSGSMSARSHGSHVDIATYDADYNPATAAEDDAMVHLPGTIAEEERERRRRREDSEDEDEDGIVSARSVHSVHSGRNLLASNPSSTGFFDGVQENSLSESGSTSSLHNSREGLLVDVQVRNHGTGSARGRDISDLDPSFAALAYDGGSKHATATTRDDDSTSSGNRHHNSSRGTSNGNSGGNGSGNNKGSTTVDILAERQRLSAWVNGEQGKFSMNIVERYDRYHRCVAFLEQHFHIRTPKRLGINDPEQVGGNYEDLLGSGRDVTKNNSGKPNGKNQKENPDVLALQEQIVAQNHKFAKVLRKFKVFFILSFLLVLGLGLMQFLVLILSSFEKASSIERVAEITQREDAATRLAFNGFYLNLLRGGYIPTVVQNIGPFTAEIVQNHMSSLVSLLEAGHAQVKSLVNAIVGNVSVYSTLSGGVVTMSLHSAIDQLITSARAMTTMAANTVNIVTNTDVMYTSVNGVGDLVMKISESSEHVAKSVQKDVSALSNWALIMLIISFVAMLLILIFFIRPTVVTIRKSKVTILSIFRALPEYPLRQLRAASALRCATLTSDYESIQEAVHDVSLFNHRKSNRRDNEEGDYSTQVQMPLSNVFLLRIATIFIVGMIFFLVLYFGGYIPMKESLQNSVTTMFYSSHLSVLTSKAATSLLMLAATSASVHSPHTPNVVSYASVRADIDELELLHTYMVHGGHPDIYSLEKSIRNNHISTPVRNLWFHDACAPVWKDASQTPTIPSSPDGPFTFYDYLPVAVADCRLYDEHVFEGGVDVSMIDFIRLLRSLTTALENNTGSTGTNAGLVLDDMGHFETFWRLLTAAQRLTVDLHQQHVRDEIDKFVIFSVISFAVFAVVLVICYFAFYLPIIINTNEQIRSIRAMMMFVPIDVLKKVTPYQEWLDRGDV